MKNIKYDQLSDSEKCNIIKKLYTKEKLSFAGIAKQL